MRDYKKIEVWRLAHELVISIYKLTRSFPREEMFGLTSQLRRAAVSVPANIAEGAVRKTKKEYHQFLYTAMGSLTEVGYYIELSIELKYINKSDFDSLIELKNKTASKLYRLIEAVEKEI
jgi:four helix bundle protein